MQAFPQLTVVDSRLQAGRGEEFSASRQKEKEQLAHAQQSYDDAEPWHLPIGHRPQDSLDTEGLAMASTDTAIPEDNRGYRMLQRMGWKGTGLGRNENGIVEPVKGGVEAGLRLGVGKAEQDTFYMAADNVVRKKLEVELQADEDQSRRDRREMQAERDERIRQDVTTMQRTFYCQTCSKQYKNAAEMEAHMSSYDHHHKKRLIEMRVDEAERTRGVRDKKEKKRADKEMARLQAQIQAAQAAAAPASASDAPPPPPTEAAPPLPPLPPEEDAQSPPPPPPQETSYPPPLPSAPAAPSPMSHHGQQHSWQPQWEDPGPNSRNTHHSPWPRTSTAPTVGGWQTKANPGVGPVAQTQKTRASNAGSSVQRANLLPSIQIKAEQQVAPDAAGFVKQEPAGASGKTSSGSHSSQVKQESQLNGAIQFGFGGRAKSSGKVCLVKLSSQKLWVQSVLCFHLDIAS
ncbi:TPA: hypothetical protein ACH3X2_011004 [Trebouxia sp. C0005]